jgi:hypothetical protein
VGLTVLGKTGDETSDDAGIWRTLAEGESVVMACDRCDAPVRVSLQVVPARVTPAMTAVGQPRHR